ncbi:MAG: hypothetical protein R3C69_01035 [Geminicoccaceae bacterium]
MKTGVGSTALRVEHRGERQVMALEAPAPERFGRRSAEAAEMMKFLDREKAGRPSISPRMASSTGMARARAALSAQCQVDRLPEQPALGLVHGLQRQAGSGSGNIMPVTDGGRRMKRGQRLPRLVRGECRKASAAFAILASILLRHFRCCPVSAQFGIDPDRQTTCSTYAASDSSSGAVPSGSAQFGPAAWARCALRSQAEFVQCSIKSIVGAAQYAVNRASQ